MSHTNRAAAELKHSPNQVADTQSTRATNRTNARGPSPARDPLAALEAARRIAFEEEQAERWDGMG